MFLLDGVFLQTGRLVAASAFCLRVPLLAALLMFAVPAQAQAGAAVGAALLQNEDSVFFADLPAVLTPSRLEVSTNSTPVAATIIDHDVIRASGYTEVIDLLRLVPGMLVANWPQSPPTLASHGLGDAYGRRLLVMINGNPVNNPFWGSVSWDNLPIRVDDIERIEVVRATGTGLMNANPFHGAINIITRDPATENGQQAVVRAGTGGFYELGARLSSSSQSPYIWRMSLSRRMMETFEARTLGNGEKVGGEHFVSNIFNFETAFWSGANDEFNLRLGASDNVARRGFPGLLMTPQLKLSPLGAMPMHRARARNLFASARWVRSLENAEFSMDYNFVQENLHEELRFDLGERLLTRQHRLELQGAHVLNPQLRMSWMAKLAYASANARQRNARARRLKEDSQQIAVNLDWQATPKTAFDFGLNANKVNGEGKILLSPRLGLRHALDESASVGLGAGISWRRPSFGEQLRSLTMLAASIVGERGPVPRLQAEKMRYVSLDYKKIIAPHKLALGARAFHERYQNYIQTIDVPIPYGGAEFIRTYNNSPEIRIKGLEFTLKWTPEWGQVSASQVFSSIRGRNTEHLYAEHIHRSSPGRMSTLQVITNLPGRWQLGASYYHTGKMRWLDQGGEMNTQNRIDLHLSKGFGRPAQENEIALTLHNLGRRYSSFDMRYRHVPRVFLSLKTSF